MKFLFVKGLKYKAIHRDLSTVLGEDAVSLDMVKRWCRRFKDGNLCLADENRPGRPKSDLADSISRLLEKESFLSARTLARKLESSPQTIKRVLATDLGMRKFTRRWIPHFLTAAQTVQRVADARRLLKSLKADQKNNFRNIMTGDESWFYYQYESDAMFAHSRDEVIPRVSKTIDAKKVMFTIFFTGTQLVNLAQLPRGRKYNAEYFINVTLEAIHVTCSNHDGYRHTKHMSIHMENCKVHNAAVSTGKIEKLKLTKLAHRPYSPDISPCDFWFLDVRRAPCRTGLFWTPLPCLTPWQSVE
jgi:histone-lysine N-methyltransferase SETMAR